MPVECSEFQARPAVRPARTERGIVDGPAPGTGYLALLLGLILGTGVLFVALDAGLRGEGRFEQLAAVVLFFIPLGGLVLVPLHAALRTVYGRSGRTLRLCSGFVIRAEIQCSDVATVERAGFIPRRARLGRRGRGLANRLTDGLRITLESGAIYYISPSDRAALADSVLANAEDQQAG